jgi:adenylate kinase
MECPHCQKTIEHNSWTCTHCGSQVGGGIVFVTGISGSGTDRIMQTVVNMARDNGKDVILFDVGETMRKRAQRIDPGVAWDRILDVSPTALRLLRDSAFQEIADSIQAHPNILHIVDMHLCFRWKAYLTKGFEPFALRAFLRYARCFINIIEDLPKIERRLQGTAWGRRKLLELLIWRDEELFLTDICADICGRVDSFAVASAEPVSEIYRIIWHPEVSRVYLSFPITGILEDKAARREIQGFRDRLREFLVVFDPYACKDYDETYRRKEMKALRREVGETTVDRDFRFIDQANAVVVYYPKKVPSKGVDSEMKHAAGIGKPVYLYCPEDLGGGPFQPQPDEIRTDPDEFLELLRDRLGGGER